MFPCSLAMAASHVPPRLQRVDLVCRAHMSITCTCARPRAHVCRYTCAQHTRIDADGEAPPRYRSSSWPPRVMPYPLALHNNLLRRVCSGISARTLPPALLLLSSPPAYPFVSWSVLRPCISSFFYPRLFALRELDAVGVSSSPPILPSAICLPTQCTDMSIEHGWVICTVCSSPPNWIIYENDILSKERICIAINEILSF